MLGHGPHLLLLQVGPVTSLELLSGTMTAMPPKPSSQQDAFMFHVLLTKTEHWAAACEKHHQVRGKAS